MPKSPPHPISTPIPELQGIATIASRAQGEWISVPREPTEAMLSIFALCGISKAAGRLEWQALLSAAPVAPSSGEWIEREAEHPSHAALIEALEAVRLTEESEDEHSNCDECEGQGEAEMCPVCFPLADEARLRRRRALGLVGLLPCGFADGIAALDHYRVANLNDTLRALELPSTPKPQELAGER